LAIGLSSLILRGRNYAKIMVAIPGKRYTIALSVR